jgi:hypothetical protein
MIGDGDYFRTVSTMHDGTLLFTVQAVQKLFLPLANRESFWKQEPWIFDFGPVGYEVGLVQHTVWHGQVELGVGRRFGQRERFRMRVRALPYRP